MAWWNLTDFYTILELIDEVVIDWKSAAAMNYNAFSFEFQLTCCGFVTQLFNDINMLMQCLHRRCDRNYPIYIYFFVKAFSKKLA